MNSNADTSSGLGAILIAPTVEVASTKIARSGGPPYVLACVVGLGIFLAFVALQYVQSPISTLPSLVEASLLVAGSAAVFAYRWSDRPPWLFAVLLGSFFYLFLVFVFVMFEMAGERHWSPLVDVLTISSTAIVGAYVGRALRRR